MTNTTPPAESGTPTPVTPAVPAQKSTFRRIITPALAAVAALAIGLFGGILISHGTSSSTSQAQGGNFAGGVGGAEGGAGRPGGAGGNFTAGTITGIDGDTITLKLTDGSTVKVTSSSDTTVTTSKTSSVSDLAKGDTITVSGTKDSDGNVTATTVREGDIGFGAGAAPASK
ncbi:DUF5666 domain-containing protein [Lacisediminihabitans changchengi]|uniref:DUF5666 domain-containing protein n=1 Tax=Lacisediminihabitans changchengi TaxID=2787634 RepID=A0A934SLU6_9MICO|nr:DUF5666 domain-containing protein [Lacisediminihabitans changchengi]MBK4349102.1 hypothetical protein [Lacisediminihabitans changchengi]